jgi:hypothetical protein
MGVLAMLLPLTPALSGSILGCVCACTCLVRGPNWRTERCLGG